VNPYFKNPYQNHNKNSGRILWYNSDGYAESDKERKKQKDSDINSIINEMLKYGRSKITILFEIQE